MLDERQPDGGGEMGFPAAGRAEHDEVGALVEPGVAGTHRHDLGPGHHRHGIEIEAVEGLAGRQPGLGEVTLDPASVALGDLVLGDSGQEPGGRPSLLVGALGKGTPELSDGGQPELIEDQAQPGGIDGLGHAACSWPGTDGGVMADAPGWSRSSW